MDTTLTSFSFNTLVQTGAPVTRDDAVKYEQEARAEARSRWKDQQDKNEMSNTDTGTMLKMQLLQGVEAAIVEQLEDQKNNSGGKTSWHKRGDLYAVKPSLLADLALMMALDGVNNDWSLRHLIKTLGKHFSCLYFAETMMRKKQGRRLMRRLDVSVSELTSDRERRADIIWQKAEKWGFDMSAYTENECVKIGQILFNGVLKGTNLIEIVLEKREKDSHTTRYPVFTAEALELIALHKDMLADFSSSLPVMVWPPREWGADTLGPYLAPELQALVKVVRNMSPDQAADVRQMGNNGELDKVYEALNYIQATPYKINEYVLAALDWLEDGNTPKTEDLKKFPDLTSAEPVGRMDTEEFLGLSKEEQMDRAREYHFIRRYNRSVGTNNTNLNKRTGIARKLANTYDRFWLPHNFDYRGRVYHIPDFGHHNSDYTRALFMFAEGKPIGDNEDVLKIQIANRFGIDKESKAKRIEWVDLNAEMIYLAGQDFIASFPFWSKADEPLQFLAACREWFNYKDNGVDQPGNPEYVSGLPAALDATQSGIQHFAAASKNPNDAEKVNCTASTIHDKPYDFYEACLKLAKVMLEDDLRENRKYLADNPWNEKDQEKHDEYLAVQLKPMPQREIDDTNESLAQKREEADKEKSKAHTAFKRTGAYTKLQKRKDVEAAEATLALGHEYNRGVIKRNAMTYAYSSRQFGFADQLRVDWMNDFTKEVRQGKREKHPYGQDRGYHAAFYLAGIHERAIDQTVQAAASGMRFLQEIGRILAEDASEADLENEKRKRNSGRHFKFKNRMGFPFHQYYRESSSKKQKVCFWDRETMEYDRQNQSYYQRHTDIVDTDKVVNGIAPNTIHSQDGCHLLMTALAMKDEGIKNFMVIHDSFATTIADCKQMDKILREQFVALYGDYCMYADILGQAQAIHSDPDSVEWPKIPSKGHNGKLLDLREVLGSEYFFN